MFLIDDLLLSPAKGILWIFREIHDAAQEELAGESDTIKAALSELYMKLETGQITEAEFDAREMVLLDRLDRLQKRAAPPEAPQKKRAKPAARRKRTRKPLPDTKPAALI